VESQTYEPLASSNHRLPSAPDGVDDADRGTSACVPVAL